MRLCLTCYILNGLRGKPSAGVRRPYTQWAQSFCPHHADSAWSLLMHPLFVLPVLQCWSRCSISILGHPLPKDTIKDAIPLVLHSGLQPILPGSFPKHALSLMAPCVPVTLFMAASSSQWGLGERKALSAPLRAILKRTVLEYMG